MCVCLLFGAVEVVLDQCWRNLLWPLCEQLLSCTMRCRWLAPVRRQLSAAVAAACQRHRRGLDRGTFPEAARPHNLLVLSLEGACAVSGLRVW